MKRVSQKFLESMALQVRGWAEDEELRCEFYRPDLNGFCAVASGELSRRLAAEAIPHEIHMSTGDYGCHVYVVIEDVIYDVTATQFPEYRNTKVLIKHMREAEVNWYHQTDEVFKTADDLRAHQKRRKWTTWQIAYSA